MIIVQTAWRNIWRQKRRTILTITAMSITSALLIFSISMQIGSYQMMIENTLKISDGYGQIQNSKYQDTPSIRNSVSNISQIKQQLKQQHPEITVGAQAFSFAILDSQQRSLGAQIMGVEPLFEKKYSIFYNKLVTGEFLLSDKNEIVLGKSLADNLKAKIGDEIAFLGSDKNGSLAVDNFKIVGLFQTNMKAIDNNIALIPLAYFQNLLGTQDEAHKVIMLGKDFQQITDLIPQITQQFKKHKDLIVMDWKKISPGIYKMIQLDLGTAIPIYLALIVVVCFGFINTMYMSVFERTKEFGMLMAIGMRPNLIAKQFFIETLFILSIGFIVGVLLGIGFTQYFIANGIYIEGTEIIYEKFGLPPVIYPIINAYTILPAPTIIIILSLISTIFPIIKINKLNIIDSMRAVK